MNLAVVLSLLLLIAGFYFGARNVHFLRNEGALRTYMENSPKARFWVQKYGMDGACRIARESFIPLGLLMSAALMGLGAWNLWRIHGLA